jgi:hypothetical protein
MTDSNRKVRKAVTPDQRLEYAKLMVEEQYTNQQVMDLSYPHIMGKVLGIVYRTLATHITKKASYNKQTAQTGATLI